MSGAKIFTQLSTSVYQHRINRLKLMTRSALVGLIHDKTMKSPSVAYNNGEATTLMSTDADSLDGIAEMIHETWAQIIEVLIGIGLLASQVGWIWPLPLFMIYCKYNPSPFRLDTEMCSMFAYESIRCKTPTAPSKSLESSNTEPHSCHKLRVEHNESCQNAWNPTQPGPSHSRTSKRRASGSFKA